MITAVRVVLLTVGGLCFLAAPGTKNERQGYLYLATAVSAIALLFVSYRIG